MLEKQIKERASNELLRYIVPFWNRLEDKEYLGFYGSCLNDGIVDKKAIKGCIYTSRILWSYSSLYLHFKKDIYLKKATSAYLCLVDSLYDKENKGFYFSVNFDGTKANSDKHLYAQGFVIYGLSQYYKITKDKKTLDIIEELYQIIKSNLIDFPNNYNEQYSYNWQKKDNIIMTGYNQVPKITTNTLLHLAEGLANYYDATKNEYVRETVAELVDIIFKYGYDSNNKNLYQFLDYDLKNEVDVISFGHNIEVSWLFKDIMETCKITNEQYYLECNQMGLVSFNNGWSGNYIYNEKLNDKLDISCIWWVQAETMIYLKSIKDYQTLQELLDFVINNFKLPNGEWIWGLNQSMNVIDEHSCCEMWKSNYHTIRCLLKLIEVRIWEN